jgi:hypothetical protein
MSVTLSFLLHFSLALLIASLWGIIVIRKNLISILIAIELLLLSASLNFIFFSVFLDDLLGQVFALLIRRCRRGICYRFGHCCYFIVLKRTSLLMIPTLKVDFIKYYKMWEFLVAIFGGLTFYRLTKYLVSGYKKPRSRRNK